MAPKKSVFGLMAGLAAFLAASGAGAGELTDQFIRALENKDRDQAAALVVAKKDAVPAEIKAVLEEQGGTAEEEQSRLFIAEEMATVYKEATGDAGPLKAVKKQSFETRLSPSVRPARSAGQHVVEFPEATDREKNRFRPDNIIIRKGSTVRWVNNDSIAHIFSSMPLIGKGGLFTPEIKPGQSWSHSFKEPGEYYYICFIHKGMIGKVTVEE